MMKGIKVVLIMLLLAGVVVGIRYFTSPGVEESDAPTAPNPFIDEIKLKTAKLGKSPDSVFCVRTYNGIKNDIEGYANAGKIDKDWRDRLLKNLDFVYTSLFNRQAAYVFGGTEWNARKLDTIRLELKKLLAPGSNIADKASLDKLKSILKQYDEIVAFIAAATNFSRDIDVTGFDQKFDLEGTKTYIDKAAHFLRLNSEPNRCTRLQKGLSSIPGLMYNKHLGFLNNKVGFSEGKYNKMSDKNEYYDRIYKPVFEEFTVFEESSGLYAVSAGQVEQDLSSAKGRIKQDNVIAQTFFSNKKKGI